MGKVHLLILYMRTVNASKASVVNCSSSVEEEGSDLADAELSHLHPEFRITAGGQMCELAGVSRMRSKGRPSAFRIPRKPCWEH